MLARRRSALPVPAAPVPAARATAVRPSVLCRWAVLTGAALPLLLAAPALAVDPAVGARQQAQAQLDAARQQAREQLDAARQQVAGLVAQAAEPPGPRRTGGRGGRGVGRGDIRAVRAGRRHCHRHPDCRGTGRPGRAGAPRAAARSGRAG
ncbi:hypothetical protein HUT16_18155 [Kitasatospora sp. NA04385]|uniref:hypothetical protein n=1 Tax=Kitasatospora sp. NA04385 TaxID=2742135 RepID=UPI001591F48E|nr:hypothetical protein [Kitasatospora sp. NA04385]QKW20739.1 hypothetical protein HUT16_18155 [Kitasatospora sp. NA04385]